MRLFANVASVRLGTVITIAVCTSVAWLCADGVLPQDSSAVFITMLALISGVMVVTALESAHLLGSWRWVVVSPLAVATLVWATTFVLRPAELYVSPQDTIAPLYYLGFTLSDLTRATAIAALGCSTWSLGYLGGLALVRSRKATSLPSLSFPVSGISSAFAIGLGVFLAGALFIRQGGPSAVIHAPGSLHLNKGSAFYGQFGIWVLEGTALYALAGTLQGGGKAARRVLVVSAPLALLSPLALASRGLAVLGLLGALLIYLRFRTPTRRTVAMMATLAVVLAIGLEFSAVVRTYGQRTDLWSATVRAVHTPPAALQVADLSVFDDLLAMQGLIPDSIGWLGGRSLAQIPAALVPRSLWPRKPQPLDIQVTHFLYPNPANTAGVPIAMQGEFFWNFGLVGVTIGGLLLGALLGASMYLFFVESRLALLLYAVVFPSTFALITRALGTMTANTVIALAGVALAYLVQRGNLPGSASLLGRTLRRTGRTNVEALTRARTPRPSQAGPPGPPAGG